jgi:threonine dehydrogenase-like Zn-dependent dehydrogenase
MWHSFRRDRFAASRRVEIPDRAGINRGRGQPGKVFDRTASLSDVAEGYRSMAERKALKVLVRP